MIAKIESSAAAAFSTPATGSVAASVSPSSSGWLLACAAAAGLCLLFWWPLWLGYGIVGGDTYFYYFPQKQFFAERLAAGEFPLWNNRVGQGYPLVAESQTGAFYPLHLACYTLLELNTAYNVLCVGHYLLAFVGTWFLARRLGQEVLPSLLAALVYVYGWFPARLCLEWAIIGGAWLPIAVWCAEGYLQTRFWRYLLLMSGVLGLQLLAGHFTLAFITLLLIAGYVPLRLWFAPSGVASATRYGSRTGAAAVLGAVALGLALGAVQLLPTWELKRGSQRQQIGASHDPGYGHIPPAYFLQVLMPWDWYTVDVDLNKLVPEDGSKTNRVEAHLYFGLVPLGLALFAIWPRSGVLDRRLAIWLILGGLALFYTPGWLLPVTRHLPGFSYFMGPGRYGVVTTLAVALVASAGFSHLHERLPKWGRPVFALAVFATTTTDLWIVSRLVGYAMMVPNPPIDALPGSPLRKHFAAETQPARVLTEWQAVANPLGVAATPVYLGIGPAAYFDPALTLPKPYPFHTPPTAEQLDWLRRAGVTHLLVGAPLKLSQWPVRLVWQGEDRYLNAALGRFGEPTFLYELAGSRGRVAWESDGENAAARVAEYRANRVTIEADSAVGGRLILTDLIYPGWQVSVDGQPATPVEVDRMYRAVDLPPGPHRVEWTYRPASIYWGGGISVAALLILLSLAHVRYWHPHWFVRAERGVS